MKNKHLKRAEQSRCAWWPYANTFMSDILNKTIMPVREPKNGRNEPGFLPYVLATVAECLRKPVAEVAEATTRTGRIFFGIPNAKSEHGV